MGSLRCFWFLLRFTFLLVSISSQLQYGVDPRIFFISLNPSSSSTSSDIEDLTSPFRFPGQACTGYNIFTRQSAAGTCQDYAACVFKTNRIIGGPCALGIKTCCIPKSTTITFENPSPVVSTTYRIHPYSNQYCQLRLDFDDFDLKDPVNGDCSTTDRFTVEGAAGPAQIPTLCGQIGGTNLNQHMYLEFVTDPRSNQVTPITLSISASDSSSNWDIRATQIECNDRDALAPSGCLQYFNTTSGTVRSFNFRDSTVAPTVTHQLNNQNYMICLRTSANSVTWTPSSTTNSFSLSNNAESTPTSSLTGSTNCPSDYVFIRNGMEGTTLNERFCGTEFPDSVTSTASPPSLLYVTDESEPAVDISNQGFSLSFTIT